MRYGTVTVQDLQGVEEIAVYRSRWSLSGELSHAIVLSAPSSRFTVIGGSNLSSLIRFPEKSYLFLELLVIASEIIFPNWVLSGRACSGSFRS